MANVYIDFSMTDPCIDIVLNTIESNNRRTNLSTKSRYTSNVHEKISYGIVLCRTNPFNNETESIICVRRVTYAFAEFVGGRFNPSNNKEILRLLSQMSLHELLIVKSCNFAFMWYYYRLEPPTGDHYNNKKKRFIDAFGFDFTSLVRSIDQLHNCNYQPIWEFPKGGKNLSEHPAIAAMREFQEETGIESKNYMLYPNIKCKISFMSRNTKYTFIYYLAVASYCLTFNTNKPQYCMSKHSQVCELATIKWANMADIKYLGGRNKTLESVAKPMFKLYKKIQKNTFCNTHMVMYDEIVS
jgi:8-oxo-dGTP pyrophosphatase MutT (NUDIX family)